MPQMREMDGAMKIGLSDRHLLKMRRSVAFKIFKGKCLFCKRTGPLEDHHYVKRKILLLRYSWRNSILVCKYGCHEYAETPEGKHKIDQWIAPHRQYLQERSIPAKQWFVEHGISRKDYLTEMYYELKEILDGKRIP